MSPKQAKFPNNLEDEGVANKEVPADEVDQNNPKSNNATDEEEDEREENVDGVRKEKDTNSSAVLTKEGNIQSDLQEV